MARPLKPQTEFGERLIQARERLGMDRAAFANALSLSKSTLANWERGATEPPLSKLTEFAEVLGVSLDWLISGHEQQTAPVPATTSTLQLDPHLLGLIVDGITSTYRTAGASLPPRHLGQLAAQIAADLMATYTDPAEQAIGLRLALEHLKRDIREDQTASGKRSA